MGDEQPVSRAQEVGDALRRMIITGEIQPAQRILAKDVASRFGVSHIPVREAMRQLEGEGMLRYQSQRGAVAAEISLEELTEIYTIRRCLESRAVAAAAKTYDEEHLAKLEEALHELEHLQAHDPDGVEFSVAHCNFHWLLSGPGCSTLMERILRDLWFAADRYIHLESEQTPPPDADSHHREILQIARSGDVDRLVATVNEHLHESEAAVLERVQHLGSSIES